MFKSLTAILCINRNKYGFAVCVFFSQVVYLYAIYQQTSNEATMLMNVSCELPLDTFIYIKMILLPYPAKSNLS